MSDLFDALDRLRRSHALAWAQDEAAGCATPNTDDQVRAAWEARQLLEAAACALVSLRADRLQDQDLSDAVRLLLTVDDRVYQVLRARHQELGSVAPGERCAKERRSIRSATVGPPPATIPTSAAPARRPTGRR